MEHNVIEAVKDEDNVISHKVVGDDGEVQKIKYAAIRGGVSWPNEDAPGYFCILGEEFTENDYGKEGTKRKIHLLSENEVDVISLDRFFSKLTDATKLFLCESLYADIDAENEGYVLAFQKFDESNKVVGSFYPAPYSELFFLGVSIIKDWLNDGTLKVPTGSIIHEQLKGMTAIDLRESSQTKFHAVNGLRHAVTALYKHSPDIISPEVRAHIFRQRRQMLAGGMAR